VSPAHAATTVTLDPAFAIGTGFDFFTNSVAVQSDGKIIVGGSFSSYNGTTIGKYIARLNPDGTLDTSFSTGTGFTGSVSYIAIQSDGKIIMSGGFNNYNGTPVKYIARLNSNGSLDTAFTLNLGSNGGASSIALQSDGKILLAGGSYNYNGNVSNIVRLNNDGTIDTSFVSGTGFNYVPYSGINSLVVQSDGKIVVGGVFNSYNGTSIGNHIARLNSNGSLDTSFNTGTGFNSSVDSLTVQSDGKFVAGGYFSSYNGTTSKYIARLNNDGSFDTSFTIGAGFNSSVTSVAVQSDGKIVAGGNFTSFNGTASGAIARLNSNGTIDTGFTVGTGFNSFVQSFALQSDGKIVTVGQSSSFNGTNSNYIARLSPPAAVATKLAITGLSATATLNSPVTFNVTAQDVNGATFPGYTGTVNFTSSDPLAVFSPASYSFTAADAGVKTIQVTFKNSGSQTVTATPTDNTVSPATSSMITVNKNNTITSLSLSPISVNIGQDVTLTATVSGTSATPTGTVTFTASPIGLNLPATPVNLVNGVASVTFAPSAAGSYNITATYNGDSTYNTSASSLQSLLVSLTPPPATTGSYYHKLTPFRLYDDRLAGTNTPNPSLGVAAGAFKASETRTLAVNGLGGLPSSGIKAITANITIISAGPGAGFLTAFPTTDSNGVALVRPVTANLAWSNPNTASLLSNFATISVDSAGKFNVYVGVAPADVIIDVTGYYALDSAGTGTGIYRNVDSRQKTFRLYDSRPAGTNAVAPSLGAGDGPLAAGKSRTLQVTGNLNIPASASAVVVNLTALNTTGSAFFNVYPSDASQPGVASLTFIPGSPALVGNLAIVPLSSDGRLTLVAGGAGSADAIVDVVGYVDTAIFNPGSNNGLFSPLSSPTRLLDTRAKGTNPTDPPLGAGGGSQLPGLVNVRNFKASGLVGIPEGAIGLVAQVTMVDTSGPGFIGLYSGPTWPGTVAVASAAAGQLPGNLAIIPLNDVGSFNAIIGANASNYIIDVVGYIYGY